MTNRPILSTKKYRPSFSLSSLKHLLALASSDRANNLYKDSDIKSKAIIQILTPFISKIEVGATEGAYEMDPVNNMSLKDKLGLASPDCDSLVGNIHNRKQYWKKCYDRGTSGENLTPVETIAADEHRYLEGMMTEEEEKAWEEQQRLTE